MCVLMAYFILIIFYYSPRHYLVPMNIAQKPRWRRKGTKLHIYNDHTFVAKHLPRYKCLGMVTLIVFIGATVAIHSFGKECHQMKTFKACYFQLVFFTNF